MTNEPKRGIDWPATLATLGALLSWSVAPLCIRYLADSLDSWTQNMLRYAVACLCLAPLVIWNLGRRRLDQRIWRRALLPAACNVLMQVCWAESVYHIGPGFMMLLIRTQVVFVAIFSMLLFPEERPLLRSGLVWLAGLLCGAGVVGVIVMGGEFRVEGTGTGVLLTFACAILWAMYIVSARFTMRDVDSRLGFAVVAGYSLVGLTVLALLFGDLTRVGRLGLPQWTAVVGSAVLAIAVAHILFYVAIKRLGATLPTLMLLSTPFLVLLVSRYWFDERLTGWQWVFGLILMFGAGLAVWAQGRLRPPPAKPVPPENNS